MLNIKNYRLGFEFCGFLLSLAMLLPNLIWSFVPAPHDILRSAEAVASLGIATLVLRLLTMATSMFVVNVESNELRFSAATFVILIFGLFYYAGWFLYYAWLACVVALVFISVAPIAMFITLSFDRKNAFSLLSTIGFAGVHLACIIYGITSIVG